MSGPIGNRNAMTHGHTHGRKPTRTFRAWIGAKDRCFNPNRPNFHRYGGRGITMCDEWRNSFERFLEDMGECPPGLSIGRIDNEGDYEPGNCAWVTREEQTRNRL